MSVAHPDAFVVSLLQSPMKRYGGAYGVLFNYFFGLFFEWFRPFV